MKKLFWLLPLAAVLAGCKLGDPNAKPEFGKDFGLPTNCRAFIQYAVDSYRAKKYSADDTFASIERNCGSSGALWSDQSK